MNESYHILMSHVTYEWVISHIDESCHIWMTYHELAISPMHCSLSASLTRIATAESAGDLWRDSLQESWHIWMSHVTHVNYVLSESCHTHARTPLNLLEICDVAHLFVNFFINLDAHCYRWICWWSVTWLIHVCDSFLFLDAHCHRGVYTSDPSKCLIFMCD